MIFKKIKTSLLLMSIFTLPMTVIAADLKPGGLFIEPGLTFETSNSSINYPSPLSNSSGKVEGFGIDAKVGFHISEVVFLALDGTYSMPQFTDSSTNYNAKATSTTLGPVVGFQMPIVGLRLWGSYILLGELNPDRSGSLDVKFSQASGFKVGAGFRVSLVSLNLEYQDLKYGQTTLEQIGPFSASSNFDNVKLNNKSWIVSVSFPLAL